MSEESVLSKKDARRRQILGATLRLLRRHGAGVTTAQIAKEANCSKETLYSWFKDRDGIMLALVEAQAESMGDALRKGFADMGGSLEQRLKAYSALLLDMMTGEAVIAVNRVAMAQACNDGSSFGDAVLEAWTADVESVFTELFQEGNKSGTLAVHDPREAFENLVGLLVGDRQRRLLLGDDARPSNSAMESLANKAVQRWLILYRA